LTRMGYRMLPNSKIRCKAFIKMRWLRTDSPADLTFKVESLLP
jgi:hypothetical protein